jgi:hypothetical protein
MNNKTILSDLAVDGFVGPARCPVDGENVTVYLSRIKFNPERPDSIKLNYDCVMKFCKKGGYCVFRDPYPGQT